MQQFLGDQLTKRRLLLLLLLFPNYPALCY